ncbi:MAG: SGNH/GDSL hydrolase family protein [Opitutaceae bacterium]
MMSARNTTPETTPGTTARAPESATGFSRRRWFRVFAVLAGLLPLVALEAGLRLCDVGRPADAPDPFAGFNRNFPLFERQGAVYRTARARAPFIAPQEFPAEKPRGSFRLFCFGGSTVYGHPYTGETAFPKWLELELAGRDPARAWQAINCGGVSYASYRIAPMVQEVLHYQPDLIIVATGHNEFLEDRTYHSLKTRSALWSGLQRTVYSLHTVNLVRQSLFRDRATARSSAAVSTDGGELSPHVNTRLDYASGYASYRRDEVWWQNVVAQYDESVRQIVAACRAAHVPVLLVRLGSNLRDCPPYKSEHRAGLAPGAEAGWQAAFDLATATERTDLPRALQVYQEAAAIDADYALLNFRIARTLDRLGRPTEALPYFERAKDTDICPLRITAPLEHTLLRIAAETDTPLVDAAQIIAARSPDGIPGNDWYIDHVHPSIGGHQLIARTIAAQFPARGWLLGAAEWPEAQRVKTYTSHLTSLGPAYLADGKRRLAWLEDWAKRQRLAAETIPNDAAGFARLAFRHLDLGDETAARDALREALKRDTGVADLVRARAQALTAQGRDDSAATLLR